MTRVGSMFPSLYLKASDIPQGRRVTVTIERVSVEEIGKDKEARPVVWFIGKEKGLVLNVTNANMITEILGTDETEDWTNGRIALYSTKVDFSGRRVDALRVDYPAQAAANGKPTRRQPEPDPLVDDPDDPAPF